MRRVFHPTLKDSLDPGFAGGEKKSCKFVCPRICSLLSKPMLLGESNLLILPGGLPPIYQPWAPSIWASPSFVHGGYFHFQTRVGQNRINSRGWNRKGLMCAAVMMSSQTKRFS